MRKLLVATCLIALVYAKHQFDFNVVLGKPTYSNIPAKYELGKSAALSKLDLKDVVGKVLHALQASGTEATLNDYADEIFANLRNLVQLGFDPVELPEQHSGFSYTLIIVYHGELDLTDGWLWDVSTLHRGGDVVVAYSSNSKYLEVTVPIAFDDLQFSYDYNAKIMGLGPRGGISGKISNLRVRVKLGFDTEQLTVSLDEFYITNSGNITFQFNGNALVDWLVNLLTDILLVLLKEVILLVVEGIVRGGLNTAVDAINDAIGSILNPTPDVTTNVASYFLN